MSGGLKVVLMLKQVLRLEELSLIAQCGSKHEWSFVLHASPACTAVVVKYKFSSKCLW